MQLFNTTSALFTTNGLIQNTNVSNPVPHIYDVAQEKFFSLLDGLEAV